MAASRFRFERELIKQGINSVAGVDEAGRGPLAGPVVAAAALLPLDWITGRLPRKLHGLNDSKQLSEEEREYYFHILTADHAIQFAVSVVPVGIIDSINILQATHRAMNEALAQLKPAPQHSLVDGLPVKSLLLPQTALVEGDARSYSIAAASVIAKVTRDRIMKEYDLLYPAYGFASHKGYATPEHLRALASNGPCPLHRRSFAPVRESYSPTLFSLEGTA